MKIILKERVESLGRRGQIVDVADGYARNFLIPHHLAAAATKDNIRRVEEDKRAYLAKEAKRIDVAREMADAIAKLQLTVSMNAHADGSLYGSVNERVIVDALKEEKIQIDTKMVRLDDPIRELGIYTVNLHLHPEVDAQVRVWIVESKESKQESGGK